LGPSSALLLPSMPWWVGTASDGLRAFIRCGEQLRHLPTGMIIVPAHDCPGHNFGDAEHPPRPRCAGSHVATSSYDRKSPKLTMILINWFAGRSGLACPFLALDPRSPARCSLVPATPNRIQSEAAFAHLCGAAPIPAAANAPTNTGSIAAVTVAPTMRSMLSFLARGQWPRSGSRPSACSSSDSGRCQGSELPAGSSSIACTGVSVGCVGS
jgi:hypothetical protein